MLTAARQRAGGAGGSRPAGGPTAAAAAPVSGSAAPATSAIWGPPAARLPPAPLTSAGATAAGPAKAQAKSQPAHGPSAPLGPVSPERDLQREMEMESQGLRWRGDADVGGADVGGAQQQRAPPSGGDWGDADEADLCVICMDAPRQLRFGCGHACVCRRCLPRLMSLDGLCPTCRSSIILNEMQRVEDAATFVPPPPLAAASTRPSTARRGGRGGRGQGWRGRR